MEDRRVLDCQNDGILRHPLHGPGAMGGQDRGRGHAGIIEEPVRGLGLGPGATGLEHRGGPMLTQAIDEVDQALGQAVPPAPGRWDRRSRRPPLP
jgi:hypothetical protein